MPIILPTERNKPKFGIPRGKIWVLHSPPGCGKTHLGTTFPNAIVIDLEDGSDQEKGHFRIVPKSLSEYNEIVDAISKNSQKYPYETVVVDSIDLLSLWHADEITEREGVASIGSVEFGRGWDEIHKRVITSIDRLRKLGKTVVLIMHTKSEGNSKSINVTKTLDIYIKGQSAVVGYCSKQKFKEGMKFFVDFGGDYNIDAKARNQVMMHVGKIPNDYGAIVNAFEAAGRDKWEKMVAWFAKQGISREAYYSFLRGQGIDPDNLSLDQLSGILNANAVYLESPESLEGLKAQCEKSLAESTGGRKK